MNKCDQSGVVLVELLIAMAVTSLILLGLTSVVFVGNNAYQAWALPIQAAAAGPPLEVFASAIQSDTHRLVPCQTAQLPGTLDLCLPVSPNQSCPVVAYTSSPLVANGTGSGGVQVFRQTFSPANCGPQPGQVAVLRNLNSNPRFTFQRCSITAISFAVITVTSIDLTAAHIQKQLNIHVAAPMGAASQGNC